MRSAKKRMPRTAIMLTLLGVCAVVAACTLRPNHDARSTRVAGCWVSDQMPVDTFGLTLDDEGRPGRFVPPAPSRMPIEHSWSLVEGSDSIRIKYGYGGFVGMTVSARLQGDSLVGWLLPFTDEVGGPDPVRERFMAHRVSCPASLTGARRR